MLQAINPWVRGKRKGMDGMRVEGKKEPLATAVLPTRKA